MKYNPEDNILSSKAKKNKRDAETKSYFDNTHQLFTPSWIKYKNPVLNEKGEDDEDTSEKGRPKGKALLNKIYGGGAPCWPGYEQFGMKEKNGRQVPNCIPKEKKGAGAGASVEKPKPKTPPQPTLKKPIRRGRLSKPNKRLSKPEYIRYVKFFGEAIYGTGKGRKRVYTQEQLDDVLPLFETFKEYPTVGLRDLIKSILSENINEELKSRISSRGERKLMSKEDVDVGEDDFDFNFSDLELSSDKEDEEERKPEPSGSGRRKKKGGCKTSCKANVERRFNEVVDNYQDVINHLEEHQAEGVGDPMDKKQARELKKDIKRINALHLVEANKLGAKDPLYQVSNPREVQRKAKQLYGKDAIVYKSSNPKKKYQIQDKITGKWVHFGDAKMEDFNKHQDPVRRERYLKRALGIKGKWRENIYSPNFLSISLLW